MATAGIIAEYNPFHNGHRFQIEETRRLTGCRHIVVVMSGSFVQRGEPALADKHLRATMALQNGADLVLELPCAYGCASAERFASGAVEILDRLGIVDTLSFGSENTDLKQITRTAKLLNEETPEFSEKLKKGLRSGLTFPQARAAALPEECAALLASPNALLGVEYCRALYKRHSRIRPLAVGRTGCGHHDTYFTGRYASASALRRLLYDACTDHTYHIGQLAADLPKSQDSLWADHARRISDFTGRPKNLASSAESSSALTNCPAPQNTELPRLLSGLMPPEAAKVLHREFMQNGLLFADDFSQLLQYRILLQDDEDLLACPDVSPELLARIRRLQHNFTSFSQFADLLKAKNITHSRIRHALLQILLGIHSYPPIKAVRVLGFRRESASLLSAIHNKGDLRLLTSQNGDDYDISADILYDMIRNQKTGIPMIQEWSKPLQIQEM